jgi:hypothetical protein
MESPYRIELSVRDPSRLFEPAGPLDAPPVLHPDAFDEILEQARAAPRRQPLEIVVRLPNGAAVDSPVLQTAFRDYLLHKSQVDRREISNILRIGWQILPVAAGFLILATAVGESIRESFEGRLITSVADGLEIFGWVALWRPGELLLYDWIPIYRRIRLQSRLANASVSIVADAIQS